jgi:hypothetical protein
LYYLVKLINLLNYAVYYYCMKKNTIIIDLDQWTIPSKKAETFPTKAGTGCSPEYISKLIKKGKIKSWKIDELGLHLVEK